jgi:methyl-accepting chemotaxis protein
LKIGLFQLVAGASTLVLVGTAAVGHFASISYRDLFLDFQKQSLQRQFNGEVEARMWDSQSRQILDSVSLLTQSSDLRLLMLRQARNPGSVNPGDYRSTLEKAFREELSSLGNAEGRTRITGAVILGTDFRTLGTTEGVPPPDAEVLARLAERRKATPNEYLRVAWVAQGKMYLGLTKPLTARGDSWHLIGTVDPLPAFAPFERRANVAFEIRELASDRIVRAPQIELDTNAERATADLTMLGPDEEPVARAVAQYDVSALMDGINSVRNLALMIFLLVSGGLSGAALLAVRVHLRRQRKADEESAALDKKRLEAIREQGEGAEAARARAEADREKTFAVAGAVGLTLDEAMAPVSTYASTLRADAERMDGAAKEAAAGTEVASSACAELAQMISSVAAGCEELQTTAREVSDRLSHASSLSADAAGGARAADGAIRRLGEASRSIGDIAKLIAEIASKTNLLALNATIEAARAGEAGKGFAVVAAEVKTLAAQTGKATEDIGTRIGELQRQVDEAISRVGGSLQAIEGVDKQIADVSSSMTQQAAATTQIGGAASQANRSTDGVVEAVSRLHASAERTLEMASSTRDAVGSIEAAVVNLKTRASAELDRLTGT